jgi:hypothetical protein
LWTVGRKGHFRSLHKQFLLGREILITEDVSLHLVWFENSIFVKPIPEALLNWEFWERFICVDCSVDETENGKKKRGPLYEAALGYLLSYTELIIHPSDYRIAVKHHLIPDMGFHAWCLLSRDLKAAASGPNYTPEKRWEYGELRLSRLNWIYKLTLRGYSYFYVYTEYSTYFGKNSQLILLGFAYCSVLLAAMQVVTTSRGTAESDWLVNWCLRFSVIVIFGVFAFACLCFGLFLSLFVYHLILTLIYHKKSWRKQHLA